MAKSKPATEMSYKEPAQVNVERAANGYVISSYRDTGRMLEVAKDWPEAMKMAKAMLGGKEYKGDAKN
jgi:hypothetical protein